MASPGRRRLSAGWTVYSDRGELEYKQSERSQGQKQATAATCEPSEAIALIKRFGLPVDRVHSCGVDRDIVPNRQGSFDGVGQKHLANSRTLHRKVEGQSSNEGSRQRTRG